MKNITTAIEKIRAATGRTNYTIFKILGLMEADKSITVIQDTINRNQRLISDEDIQKVIERLTQHQ